LSYGKIPGELSQDALFEFSTPLALDYTGFWMDGCKEEAYDVKSCDASQGLSSRIFEITIAVLHLFDFTIKG
jgi:hypothetical protein